MMKKFAVGTDIGGSHISCEMMDLETHQVVEGSFRQVSVDSKASAEEILSLWATAINESIAYCNKVSFAGVGIAIPGPFDYEKGIGLYEKVDKFETLRGVSVAENLAARLRYPACIRFMNDATAFAVGEGWIGSASSDERFLALTLGTGFGSAFMESGVPVFDETRVPQFGCLWHLPLQQGIADDYFSTRWFVNAYAKLGKGHVSGVKDLTLLASSDKEVQSLFEQFGSDLGMFLSGWMKKFDTDVVVIGGNVAKSFSLFEPAMTRSLMANGIHTPHLKLSTLMESAAITGSARLLEPSFWEKIGPLVSKM